MCSPPFCIRVGRTTAFLAFTCLDSRCQPNIPGIHPQDAEGIVQEAYLRAVAAMQTCESLCYLGAEEESHRDRSFEKGKDEREMRKAREDLQAGGTVSCLRVYVERRQALRRA